MNLNREQIQLRALSFNSVECRKNSAPPDVWFLPFEMRTTHGWESSQWAEDLVNLDNRRWDKFTVEWVWGTIYSQYIYFCRRLCFCSGVSLFHVLFCVRIRVHLWLCKGIKNANVFLYYIERMFLCISQADRVSLFVIAAMTNGSSWLSWLLWWLEVCSLMTLVQSICTVNLHHWGMQGEC